MAEDKPPRLENHHYMRALWIAALLDGVITVARQGGIHF